MPRLPDDPAPRSRPAYFWWLLANVLALCFAIVSWVICLNVFRHPENPRNYEILRKLKRLPELKRHIALDAPDATSMNPTALYRRFFPFEGERQERLNQALMRNYLTNFERPLLLNYIEGTFRVDAVKLFDEHDFLTPGFAVRGHAMVKPDEFTPAAPYPVIVEYLFPTADPAAFSWFKPGDLLSITKAPNCAAVLHVSKVQEGGDQVLCITVVPIVYGDYRVGENRTFTIEVPERLNPGAKFPIFSGTQDTPRDDAGAP